MRVMVVTKDDVLYNHEDVYAFRIADGCLNVYRGTDERPTHHIIWAPGQWLSMEEWPDARDG